MPTTDDSYKHIISNIEVEKTTRTTLNDRWIELWGLYKTLPLKLADEDGTWKSKLNDGRVFEVVETIASYLRSALFFSDNWLTIEALEPNLAEVLPIVNAYFRNTLNSSNLKREFRVFLRQLLLLGFSAMGVRVEEGKIEFEAINAYDIYIESTRRHDEHSYSFRDVFLNKSLFLDLVEDGLIDVDDPDDFWEKHKGGFNIEEAQWRSLVDTSDPHAENLTMVEYWCPVEETLYRFIDNECVGEEKLERCPWLIASIYELPDSAYGLSQIDSSIGLMLENNCIMNRRLDNMNVSVDNMWMFIDDGVTNPDDIKTAPGKVITVSRPDVLQPLYPPTNNFQVTYQESALIDQRIDKNTGTGALISSGQYRSGERVTAEEINAVKDAGGNRLTDLYEHLESTFVVPLLKYSLELLRDSKPKAVVKLASPEPGVFDYYQMLPEDLCHSYNIKVEASQSVINRDRTIRRMQEFLALVSSVPQFAELVDYNNLYTDLLFKFGFDNPERYILRKQEEAPQASAPSTPMQALVEGAGQAGGAPAQAALSGLAASGELSGLLNQVATGVPSEDPSAQDPQLQQQQMLAMNQPLA